MRRANEMGVCSNLSTLRYITAYAAFLAHKWGGGAMVAAEHRYHYNGNGGWVENPNYM